MPHESFVPSYQAKTWTHRSKKIYVTSKNVYSWIHVNHL